MMTITVHCGQLRRWLVPVRCSSHPRLKAQGEEGNFVLVFATSAEGARMEAVGKMADKYLRHRSRETTWEVTGEPREE